MHHPSGEDVMNSNTNENKLMPEYDRYSQEAEDAVREVNRQNRRRFLPVSILGLLPIMAGVLIFFAGGWENTQLALVLLFGGSLLSLFVFGPYIMMRSERAFQSKGAGIAQAL